MPSEFAAPLLIYETNGTALIRTEYCVAIHTQY
jgi:hypothetical protein